MFVIFKIFRFYICLILLLIFAPYGVAQSNGKLNQEFWPTKAWNRTDPEMVGMDVEILKLAEQTYAHLFPSAYSLLIIRNGQIVSESYFHNQTAETSNHIYSITKTIVASLLGIAITNGWIESVEENVIDLLPEYPYNSKLSRLTLEDVLTHRSGLQYSDQFQNILNQEPKTSPGTNFEYSNQAPSLLTIILDRIVRQRLADENVPDVLTFAKKYLFDPLGIHIEHWSNGSEKVPDGANGIYMTSRDLARIGYLLLREGQWENNQILSSKWVENSIKPRVRVDRQKSYGYLIWVRNHSDKIKISGGEKKVRGYFAYGHRGQFIGIYPELDLMVVTTADATDDSRDTYFVPDLLHDFVHQFVFPSILN